MSEQIKQKVNILLSALILVGMALFCVLKPETEISYSERRKLKTMPSLSMSTVLSKGTSFMDSFEEYAKDQFPLREAFRTIHAVSGRTLLGRTELNDLVLIEDVLVKTEDGIHEQDLEWTADCIRNVIDKYAQQNNVYAAVIPDKSEYLSEYVPHVDTEEYTEQLKDALGQQVEVFSLKDQLNLDHYYASDTHWRQETLTEVSSYLLQKMGKESSTVYRTERLPVEFKGVYAGQSALPVNSETIFYLTSEEMNDYTVTCYDSGKAEEMELYDYAAVQGMDPYEFFLSGSRSLITIENPHGEGELVLVRDSFGSSIAPLLASGYAKVTVVDIRYLSPTVLGKFVSFENADVLFLYSTTVMNNSVGQLLK